MNNRLKQVGIIVLMIILSPFILLSKIAKYMKNLSDGKNRMAKRYDAYISQYIHPGIRMAFIIMGLYWIPQIILYLAIRYIHPQVNISSEIFEPFRLILVFIGFTISFFGVLYYIFYTLEMVANFANEVLSVRKLFYRISLMYVSIFFLFVNFYFCIYHAYPESFSNVYSGNLFEIYFDFMYYSLGIMVMNKTNAILAETILSKIIVMVHMATTFLFIVIIIANYRVIGQAYKESINLKKGESTEDREKKLEEYDK